MESAGTSRKIQNDERIICDICKKAFKWRREAREHMKTEHNLERFFCVIAGCGVSRRTAADIQHHYKVAQIHKRAYQGNQRVATGGKDHPPPREAHIRDRGTKRPESGREKSPNVKQQETNKGGGGYNRTENRLGVKRKDPRGQHRIQKYFQNKFHEALDELKAQEKAFSGDEEPMEGTQEDTQPPGTRGL